MSEEAYDRPQSHYASGSYHLRRRWARAPPRATQAFLQRLQSGMNVLDCGRAPGSIIVGFAQIVAPGRVKGVDLNEDDVRRVEELARIVETPNATFRSADIYTLPFADESFDAVFAHGVMEHLAELDAAIRELVRVLKPGGLIGARSPDYGGHIYFPQDSLIDESLKLIEQVVKRNGGDRNIGRHLRALFIEAGIERVDASASYESSGFFDQTRTDGESMAVIFLEPSFVKAAVEEGYEDAGRLEEIGVAWNSWGERPDAFPACAWREVVGLKP